MVRRYPAKPEADHLMSFGLILNKCPGRDLLEREREYMERKGYIESLVHDIEEAEERNPSFFIAIVVLCSLLCIIGSYCCLKHRGMVKQVFCCCCYSSKKFKVKSDKGGQPELSSDTELPKRRQ